MLHNTEMNEVFEEFSKQGWRDSTKLALTAYFLQELYREDREVYAKLRTFLQESADVEEGFYGEDQL